MRNRTITLVLLLLFLVACRTAPTAEPTLSAPQPTAVNTPVPAPTAAADPSEVPEPEAPASHTWPDPIAPEEPLSRTPVSAEELASSAALANQVYQPVDVIEEALRFGRIDAPVPLTSDGPPPQRNVGQVEQFWIANVDMNFWNQVDMRLVGISEYAYFWVDVTREPNPDQIEAAKAGFDAFYEQLREVFGSENVPGVDGDPYVYVLHPSALQVCNVTESTAHQCGLGGYFWSVNQYPTSIIDKSNVHEGLIMNYDAYSFGGASYLNTLGHEFRHLIDHWYAVQAETWEIEGSAVMAEELAGIGQGNINFANAFMAEPDLQLNTWASGSASLRHYGQGYVFNRYIYYRLGPEFYSVYMQDPRGGLRRLTTLLAEQGIDQTGEQLWLDWLATLVLHTDPNAPPTYRFDDDFPVDSVALSTLTGFPRTVEDTVSQYAVDIFRLRSESDLVIDFTGTTKTTAISKLPPSGQHFWYSGRVNGAFPKLTRLVDLTGVESATLTFSTYYRFSNAFGFGYVLVSTDDGQTWQGLVSENMQGLAANDDPFQLSWVDRFYTSVAPGGTWVEDSIDLTPYAGQQILIQFASDGNDQSVGWAIDNIAIPEIDWYDDAETLDEGWDAAGWTRLTAYLPQTFHLQLITYEAGIPVVTPIALNADNTGQIVIEGLAAGNDVAYLLVSASAPQTTDKAAYTFTVSQP